MTMILKMMILKTCVKDVRFEYESAIIEFIEVKEWKEDGVESIPTNAP